MNQGQQVPGGVSQPDEFRVVHEPIGSDGAVVVVAGELDIATVDAFRRALEAATERGVTRLVVDLARVSFIDSVALGAIVTAKRRLGETGRLGVVVDPNSYAKIIFEAGGLDSVIDLFQTQDLAVAHVTA